MSVERCATCQHPVSGHEEVTPEGWRPCRSIGHPKGVPCRECRRLTGPEHLEAIQEERGDDSGAFEAAWGAYKVTLDHARQEIGPGWQAFFTDVHQSALASALIAYRQQAGQTGEVSR